MSSRFEHGYGKRSGGGRGGGGAKRGGKSSGKFNRHRSSLKFVKKVPKFLQKYVQPKKSDVYAGAVKEALVRDFKPDEDDDLPVVANMADFAHEKDRVDALIGRNKRVDGGGGGGGGSAGPGPVGGSTAENGSGRKRSKREDDSKADSLELKTGKHAFRRKRAKTGRTTEATNLKKKKRKKAARAAASLLSFDEPE